MADSPPKIENAPGLKWKRRKNGFEARWQARHDLVERGYPIKSHGIRLWFGATLEPVEIAVIQERCQSLQDDMLVWARGGVEEILKYDGTVDGLIKAYMTDPDSTYKKNRFRTRKYYRALCNGLTKTTWQTDEGVTLTVGATPIALIKARILLRWHRDWMQPAEGKTEPMVAKAHAFVGMLRTLCTFGKTILEDDGCLRLAGVLSGMKFAMPVPRVETLTADQAQLVIAEATKRGLHSMALAQAIQFECTLRQKDVIGEWIPIEDDAPLTEIMHGTKKWVRGLRWDEVDENFVFVHVTSKRQKKIEVNLASAGMVRALWGDKPRSEFPASGPVIVRESTGRPYDDNEFRKLWRTVATACGIPNHVRNMDSRAGAITEAFAAGAMPEDVRKSATHSQLQITARYSRDNASAVERVMTQRADHRNKKGA